MFSNHVRRWVVMIMAMGSFALGDMAAAGPDPTVRPADCAGRWYPGEESALSKQVDDWLAQADAPSVSGKPVAVISPHAGYQYSAATAAAGYRWLQGHSYKRVIVMAFSHGAPASYQGVDVPRNLKAYRTPLGDVPIDREVCDRLLNSPGFVSVPGIDRDEHSLELQLPFLQRTLSRFKLVPLLVGRMSPENYARAAEAIVPWLDDNTLLVASSDFTHFGPRFEYEPFRDNVPIRLRDQADQAAKPILQCDFDGFAAHLDATGDTICGRGPIKLLLSVLSMKGGVKGTQAGFDTSGRITGDWKNSVTYLSIVFTRGKSGKNPPASNEVSRGASAHPVTLPASASPGETADASRNQSDTTGTLGKEERHTLLTLARQTVTAHLKGQQKPQVNADELPAKLRADGACFVTLEKLENKEPRLRGCIGEVEAYRPLYESVIGNAINACEDRRFVHNPVTASELDELHIEISYLTPMVEVTNTDDIVVGRDGLMIRRGLKAGLLLPQVAARDGWTREYFLEQTCRKAGLPPDTWKRTGTKIYFFRAEVFGEPEPKTKSSPGEG